MELQRAFSNATTVATASDEGASDGSRQLLRRRDDSAEAGYDVAAFLLLLFLEPQMTAQTQMTKRKMPRSLAVREKKNGRLASFFGFSFVCLAFLASLPSMTDISLSSPEAELSSPDSSSSPLRSSTHKDEFAKRCERDAPG